jgi:sugar phosphate isomerase/epimerase
MASISRRDFLRTTGMTGVAALAATAVPRAWASPMGRPIGIQLYVVREPMAKDAPGTLKQLRAIGYSEVECAGFGTYTAKQFRGLIDDAGLKCPSAHLPLVTSDPGPAFDDAHALGVTYATSSILRDFKPAPGTPKNAPFPPLGRDGFMRTAERMNDLGRKAKQAGLRYAYHNHNFEFEQIGDGKTGYDLLLQETDPEVVFFEIDCGWMTVAGFNPVDYMRKFPKRIRMLHIKDFPPLAHPTIQLRGPERPNGVELGKGFIHYDNIFREGRKIGIEHCFAEEEGPYEVPQIEAAKVDFQYLNSFS